jgi:hypothetical protein
VMGDIYRSVVTSGWFRQLASVHLHIDNSDETDLVRYVVGELERTGATAKLTHIHSSIAIPQREGHTDTYHFHVPGGKYKKLKSFFTLRLGSNSNVEQVLRSTLPVLSNTQCVVEVERVVGIVDEKGEKSQIPYAEIEFLKSDAIGFDRFHTLPLEIHFSFSFRKEGALQGSFPISLQQLLENCIGCGISVDEWLLVEKANRWVYRSNSFANEDLSLDLIREQRAIIARLLDKYLLDYSIWAMVEQVLGVWKMPLLPIQVPLQEEY